MSKFHELSVLATKYSRVIFDNKAKCQQAAALVLRDYAEYLGCPVENVEFLGLDGDLILFRIKNSNNIGMISRRSNHGQNCRRVRAC